MWDFQQVLSTLMNIETWFLRKILNFMFLVSFGISFSFYFLILTHLTIYLIDTWWFCRQYGTRESKEVTVEGRVQFDLLQVMLILFCFNSLVMDTEFIAQQVYLLCFHLQVMQRDYKLSSYSLNSVSAHFLSEQVKLFSWHVNNYFPPLLCIGTMVKLLPSDLEMISSNLECLSSWCIRLHTSTLFGPIRWEPCSLGPPFIVSLFLYSLFQIHLGSGSC